MSKPSSNAPSAEWPIWLRLIVSLLIIVHLSALAGLVLSTETGPWVVPDGVGTAHRPFFAEKLFNSTRDYRSTLGLTEDYRFSSNAPPEAASRFEIRLKDDQGKVVETIPFPNPDSWPAERHRQELMAQVLAEYMTVEPIEGELIPAPGQAPNMKEYWRRSEDGSTATLQSVPEHLLPRDQELVAPTNYAQILATSLARKGKAQTDAASAEVVLLRKPTFGPVVVMPALGRTINADDFDSVEFYFGGKP